MSRSSTSKQPPPQTATSSIERSIQFSQAQAIIWQVKFIIDQINSKKSQQAASSELESVIYLF